MYNQPESIQRLNKIHLWIGICLIIAAFLFAFGQTFPLLLHTWSGRDDYSHGFLVPFISLYLAWIQRGRLAELPVTPNIQLGVAITILAVLMLIFGRIGSIVIVQEVSLLVVIPGLVLLLFGTRYIKVLALPLGYLILMVPMLDPILDLFRWPMQLFSAISAEIILQSLDIPVIRNANYIELPTVTLEVADICSGVSYLVSIIAIGIPLAQLTQTTLVRKSILITSGILIGVLVNAIRVAMIGILAAKGFEGPIHGPGHILHGFFVAQVGFVALFIGAWILSRRPLSRSSTKILPTPKCIDHSSLFVEQKRLGVAWILAMTVLMIAGSFMHAHKPKEVQLKRDLQKLSQQVGGWNMRVSDNSAHGLILGANDTLMRVYRNGDGKEVTLHIGYFESQDQDRELVNNSLGGLYKNAAETDILLEPYGHTRVNLARLSNKDKWSLALYWYEINGRVVANNNLAKAITILDGLIHSKTNGAIVIIMTDLDSAENMQQAEKELAEFAGLIAPVLQQYLP